MKSLLLQIHLLSLASSFMIFAGDSPVAINTNSLAIELAVIPSGSFIMGADKEGDWDESPAHPVRISNSFSVSTEEISLEQYQQFRPKHNCSLNGKATGMSWYDAIAFCAWVSKREGKPYRLPTEAEWEYACRAGTTNRFWSGSSPPKSDRAPNPWGLKGMHDAVMEWCSDWHGPYSAAPALDPIGPEQGIAKVIRGDKPDSDERLKDEKGRQSADYHRSANRAGMPPGFGLSPYSSPGPEPALLAGNLETQRCHRIGFRIIQAPMPATAPQLAAMPFIRHGVKQTQPRLKQAPDKPYFRKRFLLPVPPENSPDEAIIAAGFPPAFRKHNHSPALEVCPNGDLLLILYTSYFEYEPGVSLMGSRLRFGADDWDTPEPLFDLPDVNDHAPLLFTDWHQQRLYLFWGTPKLEHGSFPFQWTTSQDSGATWTEIKFPVFTNTLGPYSPQPINTAFRTKNGTLYVASDALKNTSLLWATADDGRTWFDTGGRSPGRHTTFCLLSDERFLGIGGKNTDIDGFMPQAISDDQGKTWNTAKTPFAAQAVNQRPSLLRLKSGNILFAGDFQKRGDIAPKAITERGSYLALSRDDGQSWRIKKLPSTQPHERFPTNAPTLGYSVMRQAPNGMIHLVSSMNHPCLHFEFNEAWVLSNASPPEDLRMRSSATRLARSENFKESFPNDRIQYQSNGGVADDGRFLLHGAERWYFPNGKPEYSVTYHLGRKTGTESFWRPDGSLVWQWTHRPDGISVWTQFWENGKKKCQSRWHGFMAEGKATSWDRAGRRIATVEFEKGGLKQ